MLQNRPISEIMTEDVQAVHKEKKLGDVVDILLEYSVHHVPVLDEGRLVGLVSSTDIMEYTMGALSKLTQKSDGSGLKQTKCEDIMQSELVTLSINSSVYQAAEILSRGDIHSIPIINDQQNLLGIVTSTDLINFLMNQLQLDF